MELILSDAPKQCSFEREKMAYYMLYNRLQKYNGKLHVYQKAHDIN